ncbi:MAG: hypothetical protein J7501_16105, partial [Bdellovibrio sp.]|nr:hypothetical protein [Bdellovibrio sp.]
MKKPVNYMFVALVGITFAAPLCYADDCSDLDGTYYCYANEGAAIEGDKCNIKDVLELRVNSEAASLKNVLSKTEVFNLSLNGDVSERRVDETIVQEAAVCKNGTLAHGSKSSLYEAVTKQHTYYALN